MRVPWIVRLTWQPDAELDLRDATGRPDHAKIMGYYLTTCLMVMAWFDKLPDFPHTLLIACLGYGWIGLRTFLNKKVSNALDE